ncbi:twitching motility protein PilT [Spirochaetia bacterium]|nr:twitching motility protein PilT [Spirochaetia bacterium]
MKKVFIDTNIIVYARENDDLTKNKIANNLFKNELANKSIFISVQVLNELYSSLTKHKVPHDEIAKLISDLQYDVQVSPITTSLVNDALVLKKKYKYSWWDSLILASSLENECSTVYSEDMQDGQLIENTLTIRNPFVTQAVNS